MEFDVTAFKKLVESTIETEAKCVDILRELLKSQNLNNPVVNRVIELLESWSSTPPAETLRRLEDLQSLIGK